MRDTGTLYNNRAKKQTHSETTPHDRIKEEARESYYDTKDIQDEYNGVEDIKHMFPQEKKQAMKTFSTYSTKTTHRCWKTTNMAV